MKSYKHDIYLVEPTKKLEGIVCQSLTFTNTLVRNFTELPANFSLNRIEGKTSVLSKIDMTDQFVNPFIEGNAMILKSLDEMGAVIRRKFNDYVTELGVGEKITTFSVIPFLPQGSENLTSFLEVTNGGTAEIESITNLAYKYELYPRNSVTITYNIAWDAKGNLGDNLSGYYSCTYMFSAVGNKYPTKPWSITDCINRCLECAEPLYKGQNPRYRLQGVEYENGEIKPYSVDENGNVLQKYEPNSLAEKYDKILAPEFTMTQCTLREQLKIIGGYIHAEPRLGYKRQENGQFLYDKDVIIFQPYCLGQQAEIAKLPYIQRGYTQSLNGYCTEVTSNAQNIVNSLDYAQGVIIEPNINNTRTVRTENINIKLQESLSVAKTQLPIYTPIKVECGIYNSDGSFFLDLTDITPYVFEAHEYNNLSSYGGVYPYSKSYAIYYTQGENNLEGLFFKGETNVFADYLKTYSIVNILSQASGRTDIRDYITNNFQYLTFRISYIPVYQAKFSHGKQLVVKNSVDPFVSIYNQSENLIETKFYGENIKGVAQRLGNIEQTRTYKVGKKSMIPKVGQMIDDYYIPAVTYDFTHLYYKVTVALTKDFNRISQYVGINSVKRVSEVSEKQTYLRDILIKEKICIGNNTDVPLKPAVIMGTTIPIKKMFDSSVSSVLYGNPISACVSQGKTKGEIGQNVIMLPVVSSAFGNAMVFSWTYKDNYSAGEAIQMTENDGNWQTDIPYCDYYGRLWWYDFTLNYGTVDGDVEQALTCVYQEGELPNSSIGTYRVGSQTDKPYRVRKDSREALNFNYELEFVTDREDINIGSALASFNPLVRKFNKKMPKVYFFGKLFGERGEVKLDRFVKNLKEIDASSIIEGEIRVENEQICFDLPMVNTSPITFDSWAIAYPLETATEPTAYADEDGNPVNIYEQTGGEILISSNKSRYDYGEISENVITEKLSIGIYSNY